MLSGYIQWNKNDLKLMRSFVHPLCMFRTLYGSVF